MPTLAQLTSLVSGVLVLIVLGSLYTFGAITPYISSYLYYHGDNVSTLQLSITFTLAVIMLNVGMPLASFASRYLSNRIICIISVCCLSAVVLISSFLTSFVLYVLVYGILNGLSIGFGYISPVKNAYTHFPNRKGFAAGVCMSGFGFGSVIFNYIILQLINPDNVKVDPETHHFPRQIADHLPFTLRILACCYFGAGILGSLFIKPSEQRKEIVSLVTEEQVDEVKQQKSQSIKSLFIRKKAYWLILNLACIVPFGMLVAFNYKEIAFERNQQLLQQDHFITLVGTIGIFSNGFSRTIWGSLLDKFSFRAITSTISFILLLCCGSILFAVQSKWTYMIVVPISFFCYGGTFGIFPTQTVRIFGEKLGGNIYWIVFSGFSIAAIIQFLGHYLFVSFLGTGTGYNYLIGLFILLELIGLLICIRVKYDYLADGKKIVQ